MERNTEMETLASELIEKVNLICVDYHYFRKKDAMKQGKELVRDIQQFASFFLRGNIFGMEEDEYVGLQNYVIQVLKDYTDAIAQQDVVLLIDTLEYGLRELLNIYIDVDDGEEQDG